MGTLHLMHGWTVMFGKIVAVIITSFVPENVDDLPCGLLKQPMVAHVPGLAALDLHWHMDKGVCCLIVRFETCGLLGVTNCFQGLAYSDCCLGVMKDPPALCLCCGTNNILEHLALCVDSCVVWRLVIVHMVRMWLQVVMSCILAFGSRDNKVRSIGVDGQLHVARKISTFSIWMMWEKVYQPLRFFKSIFSGICLSGSNVIEQG